MTTNGVNLIITTIGSFITLIGLHQDKRVCIMNNTGSIVETEASLVVSG